MAAKYKNPAYAAWTSVAALPWRTASCRRFNDIRNGGTPSSQTPEFWGGDVMWLTPDDLGKIEGKRISQSQRTITEEGVNGSNAVLVPPGSIVLSTRAPIGHVAIATCETAFNQGCRAIVPSPANYHSDYLYYYALACRPVLEASGNGTTFKELSWEELASLPLPLIPFKEQEAIALFLDRETARIDALTAKKRRLLELLEEKRLAVITHAVTKGLDPNVPMKDSRIAWLGQIPAHWQIKRLKYVSPKVTVGIVVTPAAYYVEAGVAALRGFNIKERSIDLSDLAFISEEANQLHAKSKIFEGDLLAVRTGQPGTTAVVPRALDGANCVDLIIIRRSPDILPEFAAYFANSDPAKMQYGAGAEGALQQHFNIDTAKNLLVPIPPLPEQRAIVDHLVSEEGKFRHAMSTMQRSVDTLTEYRSALITNAVTGKIDVRGALQRKEAAE